MIFGFETEAEIRYKILLFFPCHDVLLVFWPGRFRATSLIQLCCIRLIGVELVHPME